MNNQEILDNAPEGATHYADTEYCYRKETETDFYLWANGKWYLSHGVYTHTRSLADIKRIAELEEVLMLASFYYAIPKQLQERIDAILPKGGAE